MSEFVFVLLVLFVATPNGEIDVFMSEEAMSQEQCDLQGLQHMRESPQLVVGYGCLELENDPD